MPRLRSRRLRLRLLLIIPCMWPHFERRTRPEPAVLDGLAAPRLACGCVMLVSQSTARTRVPLPVAAPGMGGVESRGEWGAAHPSRPGGKCQAGAIGACEPGPAEANSGLICAPGLLAARG